MKRFILFTAMVAGVLALSHSELYGQKKVEATPANAQAYALLAQHKEMVGTIEGVNSDSIILRVEYTPPPTEPAAIAKVNQAAARTANQLIGLQNRVIELNRDQYQLSRAPNPAYAARKQLEILHDLQQIQIQIYRIQSTQVQQAQNKAFAAVAPARTGGKKEYLDFDLPIVPKATVRKLGVGVQFDDKGMPKEMPAAAKDGQVGIPAEIKDLNRDMQVKVYLAPGKSLPAVAKDGGPPPNRPQVRQIVILEGAAKK